MRLVNLETKNFRSLENFSINLHRNYTAIFGKNNSGKSCVFRAIRLILGPEHYDYLGYRQKESRYAENITYWKKDSNEKIEVTLEIEADKSIDPAFVEFVERISKQSVGDVSRTKIHLTIQTNDAETVSVYLDEHQVDEYAASQIRNWLKEQECIYFHDSTKVSESRFLGYSNEFISFSENELEKIHQINKNFSNLLKRISSEKKAEYEELLGAVGEKYSVQIEFPSVRFEQLPFSLSLAESKGAEVALNNWGSGTRNRTLVLSNILRAKQASQESNISKKMMPMVIVEEPEAFLHPSAQSNFGRVLEDLANELGIQILISSHSPFLLSHSSPQANILLERREYRSKKLETKISNHDTGDFLRPFAFALGLDKDELTPWADILLAKATRILIVEGENDHRILSAAIRNRQFEKLKECTIKPIGGKDKLKDRALIQFIHKFVGEVVFLLDLDAKSTHASKLTDAGLIQDQDYVFAGKDTAGKRRIEALIPENIVSEVYATNPALVDAIQSDDNKESRSAKSQIKAKLADRIEAHIISGGETPELDKILKKLDKCFV